METGDRRNQGPNTKCTHCRVNYLVEGLLSSCSIGDVIYLDDFHFKIMGNGSLFMCNYMDLFKYIWCGVYMFRGLVYAGYVGHS